ncbi:Anti-sigma-K factor RskA [Amycolatopsis arida]|uniref:Regulator of SigK n=1 Tax=Amycolatopsis arida TaxID=587909 RepID=A0A1I5ZD97_9PSEU|nr:anti-sigma factor [Amycolatopsis arida]TDX89541.1 anti-sigma-K factor RskA [Amycolatopsis arida]SFQ54398.1 Anti-sigma-K factor RskA [Amycolatopsis arida]
MATLTGGYVLNALSDDERAEFERHLATCESCAQEVIELRETVSRLGMAEQTPPPPDLKNTVLAEIANTRQKPPSTAPSSGPTAHVASTRPWHVFLASAAAVVALAAASVLGVTTVRAHTDLHNTQHALRQAATRNDEIADIVGATDARMIVAVGPTGMRATTVASQQLGKALFLGVRAQPPPLEHTYQLWFVGQDGLASAGLPHPEQDGRTVPLVIQLPATVSGLAVTIEPAGGSAQPTTGPLLQMTIPT